MNGAGTPGPDEVRGELERNPRDPFKGNITAVLAELEPAWRAFRIGYDGTRWTAQLRDSGAMLREMSPDDLITAMRRETAS